jgi:hypothetical protein
MLMNTHEARLDALRKELKRAGWTASSCPISDEHMSEYVGAYAQRLAWLTGFGGSAGTAVVLTDAHARPAARCSSTGAIPCKCAIRSMGGCMNTKACPPPAFPNGWRACARRRADRL